MAKTYSRRMILSWIPLTALAGGALLSPKRLVASKHAGAELSSYFPSVDPKRASEVVLYSHTNIDKVADLLEVNPELSLAAIDWGFGDWESAIGAAAHMGRRDIAELLLKHGARPDLFTHAMLGHVDVVRATIEDMPGIQGRLGPHGISLMSHAKAGKEHSQNVVAYLEAVGGADPTPEDKPLPMSEDAYVGSYRFNDGPEGVFRIENKNGRLRLRAANGFPRRLFHIGDNRFYPEGARSIVVSFRIDDGSAVECTIADQDLILSASRTVRPR